MVPQRPIRLLVICATLVALDWIALASFAPQGLGLNRYLIVGHLLGSVSAQATIAGAWLGFGPGKLAFRLAGSLGWVFAVTSAVWFNVAIHSMPDMSVVATIGGCLLGQWLLVAMLVFGLRSGLNVQLICTTEPQTTDTPQRLRFGIRHLLIITVAASVILGIGRALLSMVSLAGGENPWVFVYLAVGEVLISLPLLVATLMRKLAWLGILLALGYAGLVTAFEIPLFAKLGGNGPDIGHFIAINAATCLVTLAFAGVVRFHGLVIEFVRHVGPS